MNNLLSKAVIFLGFFPFISPVPTATDSQPVFFLAALAALLINSRKLRIHKYALPLMLFGVVELLPLSLHGNSYRLTSRLDGSFATIALLFFYVHRDKVTPNLVFSALIVTLVCAIFNFVAPASWAAVANQIMYDFRAENILVRGAGGLNPESGFLGAFGAFFMAMGLYFFETGEITKRKLIPFFLASILCVLLSKSGTGYLLFTIVIVLFVLTRINAKRAALVAIALAMLFATNDYIGTEQGNRGLDIMARILQDPSQAISSDVSIMLRIFPMISGVSSLINGNAFGYGPGSFDMFAYSFANTGNVLVDQEVTRRIAESGGGASALGRIMVEFGLVGLILALTTVVLAFNFRFLFIVFLSWAFILASFSFSFPLTWLIVSLSLGAKRALPAISKVTA